MVKRVVVGVAARGYVDGRYLGEEKETNRGSDDRTRARRGKAGGGVLPGGGKRRGSGSDADNIGNSIGGKRRRGGQGKSPAAGQAEGQGRVQSKTPGQGRGRNASGRGAKAGATPVLQGDGQARPQGQRRGRGPGQTVGQGVAHGQGAGVGAGQSRNQKRGRRGGQDGRNSQLGANGLPSGAPRGQPRQPAPPRASRGGKRTPFRAPPMSASPSEVTDFRRVGDEAKTGQFAEALASEANVKRERLHKVLAQSGHGSRRDMEIMISSGRVMVNGIVATTGTQVSPGDNVMVDQRPVKLKFDEELPRILLYHKPEGEIVTTSDPGNRITVFDNLPRVENGKWVAIGRLDINTSGLLIFTTNGELANRMMHPRYEVEREYAVRILGELTDEQTHNLLAGVNIEADEESDEPSAPARFDTIEARGGEGVNHWYHVTIKEGRNREVRKMFETQGLTVSRLIRTRFGKIELPPRLARGKLMELDEGQVNGVLGWVGMKPDAIVPGQFATKSAKPRREPRSGRGAAEGSVVPERGNELGPIIDVHAMDAADDIGNSVDMGVTIGNTVGNDIGNAITAAPLSRAETENRVRHDKPEGRGGGRGGLRGRGGRGRGSERGRRPAVPGGALEQNQAQPPGQPTHESFATPTLEFDGNRVKSGDGGVIADGEKKRNPKNRRRMRRGPRGGSSRGTGAPNTREPGEPSGNGGGGQGGGEVG